MVLYSAALRLDGSLEVVMQDPTVTYDALNRRREFHGLGFNSRVGFRA